jgi:hypothetical protein
MPPALARPLRPSQALLMLLMTCVFCGAQTSKAATANPVWRCPTTHSATVTYQSMPCQNGGQVLPASKHPTPEDHQASVLVAKRESDLARTMGQQRARHERTRPAAHASLSGPVRQVSVGQPPDTELKAREKAAARAKTKRQARQRRQDVFRAEVPGPRKRSGRPQAEAASASPP